jgi:hypothetical protein
LLLQALRLDVQEQRVLFSLRHSEEEEEEGWLGRGEVHEPISCSVRIGIRSYWRRITGNN